MHNYLHISQKYARDGKFFSLILRINFSQSPHKELRPASSIEKLKMFFVSFLRMYLIADAAETGEGGSLLAHSEQSIPLFEGENAIVSSFWHTIHLSVSIS